MDFVPIEISSHKSLAKRGARQIAQQARTRQPVAAPAVNFIVN